MSNSKCDFNSRETLQETDANCREPIINKKVLYANLPKCRILSLKLILLEENKVAGGDTVFHN